MSKKIYLFSLVLLALTFTACSETEETGKYDNWQARNEAFIDSIANRHADLATRGNLDSIHMITYSKVPIYFKKKTPVGDGKIYNVSPRSTDVVTVYYKGSYILGSVDEQDNFVGEVVEGVFTEANPSIDFSRTAEFAVNSRVIGLSEVLQRMKVGERYEIYVPWKYGYGSSEYTPTGSSIPIKGYSTLIFDIQIISCEF
mgnify:FL=1